MTGFSLVNHHRTDDFKKRNMSSDAFRTIEQFGNTNIMLLDIIQHPIFVKNNVLETGFCLRLQVKPSQLGPVDRAGPYLWTHAPTHNGVYKPSTAQTICES
jgi:hypothetical protein